MEYFEVPILISIFRRPDTTEKVFHNLKQIKPKKLFIVCDGPHDNSEEIELVNNARLKISLIDWDCKLETIFFENNIGIKNAIYRGFEVAFSKEEKLIFFEDDILPSYDFFPFMEKTLEIFKDDQRIWHINGCNLSKISKSISNYYYSRLTSFWGMGTWKRVWKKFDYDLILKHDNKEIEKTINLFSNNYREINYFSSLYNYHKNGLSDNAFDQRWLYNMWFNKCFAVTSSKNLIINIGIHHPYAYSQTKSIKSYRLQEIISKTYELDTNKIKIKKFKYSRINDFIIMNYIFCPIHNKIINSFLLFSIFILNQLNNLSERLRKIFMQMLKIIII